MSLISVIIPCYNSEKTITTVVSLTVKQLIGMGYDYQILLINDGSKDRTFEKISELCGQDKKIQGCDLAKNFGQQNAIMAGLQFAEGDYILGMDDDLQTHPSQIPKLVTALLEGHDVVFGRYEKRKYSFLKRLSSRLNNLSLQILINKPKGFHTSSFWICKKFVKDEIIKYKYQYTHLQGMFIRTTNNIVDTEVEHFERQYGKSNYNFFRLLKLWGGCTNFSVVPLRFFLFVGLLSSLTGFISAIVIVIKKLTTPDIAVGWPSVICTILIFSGLILFGLGIVGEYVGRIFMCINVSPQYVIRDHLNAAEDRIH